MGRSFYIIDGHAQVFRAYYAPFGGNLTSPSGEPTKATYVFCSMLFNLLREKKPDYLAVAFDVRDSSAPRQKIYPDYKSSREATPEDLIPQIDRIQHILEAAGIPTLMAPGYEADDIMATLAARDLPEDLHLYLVSKDKDLEQLLNHQVSLYDPGKDEVIDPADLEAKKGYRPDQAVEIQTLCGDNVDDIPGVKGIGPKTAVKLIQKYGTAQAVLDHAKELTPKQKENVLAFRDQMPITRQLVTLMKDVPIDATLEDFVHKSLHVDPVLAIFEELGFNRLREEVEQFRIGDSPKPAENRPVVSIPSPDPTPAGYHLINTKDSFETFLQNLARQSEFCFDTETTSLERMDAQLVGISFSWASGVAYYLPVRTAMGEPLDSKSTLAALKPIFENPDVKKIGQNLKYDLLILRQAGIHARGIGFDTMIASALLDPLRRSHGIDFLAQQLLGHRMMPISDLIGKGKNQITIDQAPLEHVSHYACEDADITWQIKQIFAKQIEDQVFHELFYDTEMPLMEVLAEMEFVGVALDTDILAQMSNRLADRLVELTCEIHQAAGRSFNIDSTQQLQEILFDEQKLRVVRKTKTGRSTDAETLAILDYETDNPIPGLVLEYRELAKLKSTYVDKLPEMLSRSTGRIHAHFNQTGAVTGRLSSSDPNLQNIPIRTETGREIRKAFVTGNEHDVLLTADYSQIELRMLAHYCQDPDLLQAFRDETDIHAFVASQVFGIELTDVTKEQRGRAKAVNFGIIYGQSPFGLARTTGMDVSEAKMFIDTYFRRYPGIRRFIDQCIADAKKRGYVSTILGRRRPITELDSRNRQRAALGERLAVNTVLQGSAADLIKRAMIHIHRRIQQEHRPVRLLIQVHDELVCAVPRTSAAEEADMIRQEMITAIPLDVPITVDVAWGDNWLEGK
jgi:DNA polymerase-1